MFLVFHDCVANNELDLIAYKCIYTLISHSFARPPYEALKVNSFKIARHFYRILYQSGTINNIIGINIIDTDNIIDRVRLV